MATHVQATIIGGPGLPGYGFDDGTQVFSVGQGTYNVQLHNILANATFGFYFADSTNPSPSLIPIFGADDSVGHVAIVDFGNKIVTDEDQAPGVAEFDFSSLSGSGDIGFFYGTDLFTLYSETFRNGGVDAVGTFPSLLEANNYLIGFELFNPNTQAFDLLSVEMVVGVTPTAVPEPATLMLLGSGIISLAAVRRRMK